MQFVQIVELLIRVYILHYISRMNVSDDLNISLIHKTMVLRSLIGAYVVEIVVTARMLRR